MNSAYDDEQFEAFSSTMSEDRTPCGICGRNFNPNALVRHMPICEKSANKQRKAFDSSKQRADGTDIASIPGKKTRGAPARREPPPKKNNWRAKHEDFINNIRAARGIQAAIDSGKPLPPPPAPSINPDYDQCPYCDRRFNSTAAERHIPFCKEQQARKKITSNKQQAAQKMKTRTSYKPPKPQARGSSGHSGNSANGRGYGTSPSSRGSRNGSSKMRSQISTQSAPVRGTNMRNSTSLNGLNHGYGDGYDDGSVSPASGAALRTGRTPEGYSDARDLGAKAKIEALSKKYPSNDSIHKSTYNRMEIHEDLDDERVRNAFDRHQTAYMPNKYSQSTKYSSPTPEQLRRVPSGNRKPRATESGYYSNNEDARTGGGSNHRGGGGSGGMGRFCHECGTKYPVSDAKFCCECGIRRMKIY